MEELFRGRYRVKSARCPKWDYRSNGAYFITICTHNREKYFGQIVSGEMILSESGLIVQKNWQNLPDHFDCIEMDSFVVMPNHFHGIIIINNELKVLKNTTWLERRTETDQNFYSEISPKRGSLSSVIRSFKSSSTREINLLQPLLFFKWQARFHDQIIRNISSHRRIRNYIINNPKNWRDDYFNS